LPDEQELILKMRERLCSGCGDYGPCWAGDDNCAARFLCRLIEEAVQLADEPGGLRVLYSDGEVPPDVLRFCRRGRMIPDRLGLLLRDFAERRRSEIKRCATGQLLSVQLLQAREILYDLAEKQLKPLYGRKTEALQAALDFAFSEMDLAYVEADHMAANPASGAVMRKAGMTYVRTDEEKYVKNGQSYDTPVYRITAQQWKKRNS
jgi:hypothetical protein